MRPSEAQFKLCFVFFWFWNNNSFITLFFFFLCFWVLIFGMFIFFESCSNLCARFLPFFPFFVELSEFRCRVSGWEVFALEDTLSQTWPNPPRTRDVKDVKMPNAQAHWLRDFGQMRVCFSFFLLAFGNFSQSIRFKL